MTALSINELDIKKAQLEELTLKETYVRSHTIKAYEILPVERHELHIPELLSDSIRTGHKPVNILKQVSSREISGRFIQEEVVAQLHPNMEYLKSIDVANHEISRLEYLTVQTKFEKRCWKSIKENYRQLQQEIAKLPVLSLDQPRPS